MCRPASLVLTENGWHWLRYSDSHERIVCECNLRAVDEIGIPLIVRAEVFPADGNFRQPVQDWIFSLDQPQFPDWFVYRADRVPVHRIGDLHWWKESLISALTEWKTCRVHFGEAPVKAYGEFHCLYDQATISGFGSASLFDTARTRLFVSSTGLTFFQDEASGSLASGYCKFLSKASLSAYGRSEVDLESPPGATLRLEDTAVGTVSSSGVSVKAYHCSQVNLNNENTDLFLYDCSRAVTVESLVKQCTAGCKGRVTLGRNAEWFFKMLSGPAIVLRGPRTIQMYELPTILQEYRASV